jgi:uncharacterized protein
VNPLTDVFADSVFWIGFVFDRDQHHASAIEQAALIHGNIVTSHPVLVETINSLSKPAWRAKAIGLVEDLYQRKDVIILYPTPLHWQTAWQMFILHSDKGWSYTDCCSFVLMREQGLTRALTADQHFRQAGFAVLL